MLHGEKRFRDRSYQFQLLFVELLNANRFEIALLGKSGHSTSVLSHGDGIIRFPL